MAFFIELNREAEFLFSLEIGAQHCVGPKGFSFLFGGAAMAAAITAMEQSLDRELVLANAQFQSFASFGSRLNIAVTPVEGGRSLRRAKAVASVSDKTVFTVNGVLGGATDHTGKQWTQTPAKLPPPEKCPAWLAAPEQDSNAQLLKRLDVRLAIPDGYKASPEGDGSLKLWIKPKETVDLDAAFVGLCADFLPAGIGAATNRPGGGNSLDNQVRIIQRVPSDWILCDINVHHAGNGLGHGDMRLFAQDGRLMATASQTLKLR